MAYKFIITLFVFLTSSQTLASVRRHAQNTHLPPSPTRQAVYPDCHSRESGNLPTKQPDSCFRRNDNSITFSQTSASARRHAQNTHPPPSPTRQAVYPDCHSRESGNLSTKQPDSCFRRNDVPVLSTTFPSTSYTLTLLTASFRLRLVHSFILSISFMDNFSK